MPTKPKKRSVKKKTSILPPRPPVRKLPPGFKGARIEHIMAKAKELWDPADPELDKFLENIRRNRYTRDPLNHHETDGGKHSVEKNGSKKKIKVEFPKVRKRKLPGQLPVITVDDFMGKGNDLWKSDEELDQFLEMIRESRKD